MNDRFHPDAATLVNDDDLLDALGRGERPRHDDPIAVALAMWRAELDAPAAPEPAAQVFVRRPSRKARWGIISAAVAAIVGGGVAVAAASTAEPGSPLWPITQRVWVDRATSASAAAQARVTLDDARTAVTEQRVDDAERLLTEAESLIGKVTSVVDQQMLQAELTAVRGLLDGVLGTIAPTPTPAPGAPGPAPTSTPSPGLTTTPSPEQSESGGLLPLPTPSLPLPSLPLLGRLL